MKILFLGDPHVMAGNIEESERLLQFTLESAIKNEVDLIILPGDLAHTHAILRVEVLTFWLKWLPRLAEHFKVIVLVGNHDMRNNEDGTTHGLSAFNHMGIDNLNIVQSPVVIDGIGYLPYIHNNVEFVEQANALDTKTIVSHTTYEGAKFENNFYAPDGVNPEDLNATLMISGHIHCRNRLTTSKRQIVAYPGTGRWLTASDANQLKGLWLANIDPNGSILSEEFLDTSHVCTPILSLEWKEGSDQPEFPKNAKISMELVGSSDWVSKRKSELKGTCSIKTKITDPKKTENRKAGNSLQDYLQNVYKVGSDKSKLLEFLKELKIV